MTIRLGDLVNHAQGYMLNPAIVREIRTNNVVIIEFTGSGSHFRHTCYAAELTVLGVSGRRYGPYKPIAKALPG